MTIELINVDCCFVQLAPSTVQKEDLQSSDPFQEISNCLKLFAFPRRRDYCAWIQMRLARNKGE